jgi:hypothetical protein
LATAKLSEPLKKTPENEMILRVRLDYWFYYGVININKETAYLF